MHSSLTRLVSKQLISELKLEPKDCIFILDRGMKAEEEIYSIDMPYTLLPKESFSVSFSFWENWPKIKELDVWLKTLSKEDTFYFYKPQSGFNVFHLIISHPLCKGFYYIEEGRSSYRSSIEMQSSKQQSWLRDRLYSLNFKNRSKSVKHFFEAKHPQYLGAYGISEWTFPDLSNTHQLKLPFQKKDFKEAYQKILVLEPIVEFGMTSLEAFRYGIEQFLELHIKEGTLYFKYHPSQKEAQSIAAFKAVCDAFPNINFKKIPSEVSLEEVAISTEAIFYIITSSVGLYASICGSEVYSIAKYIIDSDKDFQKSIEDLPAVFKDQLNYLA